MLILVLLMVGFSFCENYNEKLLIEANEEILLQFNFNNSLEITSQNSKYSHFNLFPKSIGTLVQSLGVVEFSLTFTQGRHPSHLSQSTSPTGTELIAWFDDKKDVRENWAKLTNSLAGQFCASLNFMTETATVEPQLSFQPDGPDNYLNYENNSDGHVLRYSVLPREITCTENLTPFLKLLPCKSKHGLSSLLNPYAVYDTSFHSMRIHFSTRCGNALCTQFIWKLEQSLIIVFDQMRMKGLRDWSLDQLLNRRINGICPLASQTNVLVAVADGAELLSPSSSKWKKKDKLYENYEESKVLSRIGQTFKGNTGQRNPSLSPVIIDRYFSGYGQERGGLRTVIMNNSESSLSIIYFDILPWYMRIYLHTFKIQLHSKDITETATKKMVYSPAVDRVRPTMIELQLEIPPTSQVVLSFDFDKAFLKYTEYPFDANRGFDVSSPIISLIEQLENNYQKIMRYTGQTLLLTMPTPDFTMPYNVITLTCTMVALFYGSMFNLLYRRFYPKLSNNPTTREKILRKFKTIFGRN